MKCNDVQRYCIEQAGSPLEARYEEHLASCADCRRVYERTLAVCRLVALKRYEQPDPQFEMRTQAAIRRRIAEDAASSWAERIWGVLEGGPVPAFRYALAAAVIAMVGVNVMLTQQLPSLNAGAAPEAAAPRPAAEPIELASTNGSVEPYAKPVFVFEYPSNRQPSGSLQYGPGSVPVRYDIPR